GLHVGDSHANLLALPLAPALAACGGGFLVRLLLGGVGHLGSLPFRRGGGRGGHRLLLHHHALALALAGASVGVGPLPAHRQALAVSDAPVAADVHEPLHAHRHLAPQVALDLVLALDDVAHAAGLVVAPGLDPFVGVDPRIGEDLLGRWDADPVDVLDRDLAPLVPR